VTTLRERKRQDTRARLLSCAVELFVDRGYDATSMDDVAARAEVSRATAFNYFARKEDLLVAWADGRRQDVRAGLSADPSDSVAEGLENSIVALAGWYVRDSAVTRPMIRCWLRAGGPLLPSARDSAEMLAAAVRAGQRSGEFRTDIDAAAAGRLLLNGFLGAAYRWAATDVANRWLRKEVQTATRLVLASLKP
jgi:AcrR family transcriptional regulator